ncbi:hypothetical protein LP7551_00643 [Roseibium album]|nr:hypothetical protein LP7551_00643 [Roseibium album]
MDTPSERADQSTTENSSADGASCSQMFEGPPDTNWHDVYGLVQSQVSNEIGVCLVRLTFGVKTSGLA